MSPNRQFLSIALVLALTSNLWGDDAPFPSQSAEPKQSLQTEQDHAEFRHLLLRESARNAKSLGNVPRSLELYKELIDEFPENKLDLREYLGTLMQFGKMHEAAVILEKELVASPKDQESLRMMVDVQLGLRQLDHAELFAQTLLQLDSGDTATQLKLAGVFAHKKQWKNATTILHNIAPDALKQNSPFALKLAEIHLVLGNDSEAAKYLLPLLNSNTEESQSSRALLLGIWLHAKQKNGPKVEEYLQKLDEANTTDTDYSNRFHLVNVLLDSRLDALAQTMATQLAQKFPDNPECFLVQARIDTLSDNYVAATNHIDLAAQLLTTQPQADDVQKRLIRLLNQSRITLHEVNSEHILERHLLQALGQADTATHEFSSRWKRFADTYAGTGEYDKAEQIYRLAIEEASRAVAEPVSDAASLDCSQIYSDAIFASQKLLESISRQRKVHELPDAYFWTCSSFPDLPPYLLASITLTYANEMIRYRCVDTVESLLDDLVHQPWCNGEERALTLALLGDCAYYRGNWDEALSLYNESVQWSRGQVAAVYGVIRILRRQNPALIPTVIEDQLFDVPNAVQIIVALYYRAMDEGDKYGAVMILNSAQNMPAQNRSECQAEQNPRYLAALAHWYFTTGETPDSYIKATCILNNLCVQYPDNIAFRKSLLDAYSAGKQFSNALIVQRQLLADDPYHLEYDLIGLRIRSGLMETFDAEVIYSGAIQKRRHFALDLPELAVLQEGMKQRDIQILALEREAWINRINRPEASNRYYEQERRLRLYDETIPYQMGINCDSVERTSEAYFRYRQSLRVNPFNKYDHCSLNADFWRLRPQLSTKYEFFDKQGRDGLADIQGHRIPTEMMVLFNNRNEYASAGYAWSHYETPYKNHQITGHSFLFSYRKKIDPCRYWEFFTDLEATVYDRFIATRPTSDFGLVYNRRRDYSCGIAGRLQQVMENAGTIQQDIYRFGGSVFGEWHPSTRWKMDGSFDYFRYSDRNDLTQLFWNNKYLLWSGPKHRFDLLGAWQYQNFGESVTAAGPDILTMRHPYFAPAGYHFFDLGCRWEWQISKHPYNGIQEKNFFLEYRHRWDTRNTQYEVVQSGCHWEVAPQLRLEGSVRCIVSKPYDELGFQLGGTWRF